MRKTITTLALALGLVATSVYADQKTVTAMNSAGITLNPTQAAELKNAKCGEDCSGLTDKIAALISANSGDANMVEAIMRAAASAHPQHVNQFGDAAMLAAPEQIALIAGLVTELAPTAAGNQGENGRVRARIRANFNNNIPTPPGGGGSSSPS